jgi:hypothetical protein
MTPPLRSELLKFKKKLKIFAIKKNRLLKLSTPTSISEVLVKWLQME